MKDFTGRKLNKNDLVVSKPSCRHAQMRYGIMLSTGSVWYGPNSIGGSDIIKLDTTNDSNLEIKRKELIKKREEHINFINQQKKYKDKNKIKKKDLKLYHIYDNELYVGKCKITYENKNKSFDIKIKEYNNAWVKIYFVYNSKLNKEDQIKNKMFKFNLELSYLKYNIRDVKYPQKLNESKIHFTKKEVIDLFNNHIINFNKNTFIKYYPIKIELDN